MDQATYSAIATMYNGFRSAGEDTELRLRTLGELVRTFPSQTVVEVAKRFAAGKVEGQHPSFAPSTAEFMREVERLHEIRSYQPKLSSPVSYPSRGALAPFQIKQQKALNENANRPIIMENASFEDFKRMSRAGELPKGSVWVACLATIYGPEPKQQLAAE